MYNPQSRFLIRMNLRFFADADKTEKATPRKKEKAREEGQVAKSSEVGTAFLFLAAFLTLKMTAGNLYEGVMGLFSASMQMAADVDVIFDNRFLARWITHLMSKSFLVLLPLFAVVIAIAVLVNVAQVGWKVTGKPLRPKFSRMSPISGFKRLFSGQVLIDLLKSLLKFAIIGLVIYNALRKELNALPKLADMSLFESMAYLGGLIVSLGVAVGGWFMLIAAMDFAYTRFKHAKELRMSKQEIKDEYKMIEGNPQVKGQIKQKMREVSTRRMMEYVPGADVVVTNPTHYAVALKYEQSKARAPLVVAKGADHIARRIREKAAENQVAIIENKELAQTLYRTVDIGQEIPRELYEAVAEILAFVYRLKKKR